MPAAYFLADGNQYAPDETRCKVTVPVIVGEDRVLRLGIRKTGMEGRVYMDNMTLTYLGNTIDDQFGFGVDAYGAKEEVDAKKYTKPGYMFYLSRMFADGVWNALTLPVNLTSVQLTNTFGNDMELVKLTGLNPQNPNQIFFEPVNLNGGEGLEAGQCYLVKVTKAPEHPANENSHSRELMRLWKKRHILRSTWKRCHTSTAMCTSSSMLNVLTASAASRYRTLRKTKNSDGLHVTMRLTTHLRART